MTAPLTGTAADASWAETLARYVSRLNLASPASLAGEHFPQIVALTCLVTGGFLLLFGWRHRRYVLGVVGLLAGGWIGLAIKGRIVPTGVLPALPYLALCGAAGVFLALGLRRFVGILLGGFTAACVAAVFVPAPLRTGQETTLGLCLAFLFGGGLGALFPRFFFIVDASLAGASFCTYALSVLLALAGAIPATAGTASVLLHLGLFLPLFAGGIVYQYLTAPADGGMELAPTRRAQPPRTAAGRGERIEEPVGAAR